MIATPRKSALGIGLLATGAAIAAWTTHGQPHAGQASARNADTPYTVLADRIGFANDIATGPDGRVFVSVEGGPVFQFFADGQGGLSPPQAHASTQRDLATSSIESPRSLAVDRLGNLFVEDHVTTNGCIAQQGVRKLAPDNVVSTLTEQGYQASQPGGASISASPVTFTSSRLEDMASDAAGNVYVNNGAVSKITPAGRVSVVYDPWKTRAGQAHVPLLSGLAPHPDGSLLVLGDEHAVYKISPAGVARRIAGQAEPQCPSHDGPEVEARLCGAQGLAAAPDGAIYVLEECEVRKISADGAVSTVIT